MSKENIREELLFGGEDKRSAKEKKGGFRGTARTIPHTEESLEEEQRVNPPGRSKGYKDSFWTVEDIDDYFNDTSRPREEEPSDTEQIRERFNRLPVVIQREILNHLKAFKEPLSKERALAEAERMIRGNESYLAKERAEKKSKQKRIYR